MTFSLDIRAHSEIGLVRKNNQDSGYASPTCLVVADGMGGAAAGDLASTVAIAEVQRSDRRAEGEDLVTLLAGAVSRANDTIADLVAADHSLDGMGTTVCGALFSGTQLGLVHIGDSRGYLMRAGKLLRLTHDHSWVQSLIDDGRITEDEAAVHPHRSLVLKVLNGHPNHSPDTEVINLEEGDRVLFCSDGLCGFTTEDVMADILTEDDLDVVMADLIQAAHLGGGADNITIVLAQVVPQDDALDAREAKVIGAAEITEVPDLALASPAVDLGDAGPAVDDGSRVVPKAPAPAVAPEDQEVARYRPTLMRRRRWLPAVLALSLVLVTTGALWGGWSWSKTQYFVGDHAGKVAIFNGVEGSIAGRSLSSVHETSQIEVATLPRIYRQQVTATIKTSTLEAAQRTVEQLKSFAGACSPQTSTPSPTPAPSSPPTPDTSSSPATSITPGTSISPASTPDQTPSSTPPSTPSSPGSPEGDC